MFNHPIIACLSSETERASSRLKTSKILSALDHSLCGFAPPPPTAQDNAGFRLSINVTPEWMHNFHKLDTNNRNGHLLSRGTRTIHRKTLNSALRWTKLKVSLCTCFSCFVHVIGYIMVLTIQNHVVPNKILFSRFYPRRKVKLFSSCPRTAVLIKL